MARTQRELGEQPAIGQLIVENNWIAGVLGLTGTAKSSPEGIVRRRTKERSPRLIKDLETEVAHDDDMVGADLTVGIRRRHAALLGWASKLTMGGKSPFPPSPTLD